MMFQCILLKGSSLRFQRAQEHRKRSPDSKYMIVLVMLFLPVFWGPDYPINYRPDNPVRIIRSFREISGSYTVSVPLWPVLFLSRFSRGADNPAQIWNIRPDNPPQVFPQRLEILGGYKYPPSSPKFSISSSSFCPPLLTLIELAISLSLQWILHLFERKDRGDLDLHIHQSKSPLCEGIPLDLDLGEIWRTLCCLLCSSSLIPP